MFRLATILLLFVLGPQSVLAQRLFRERRPAMGATAEVLVYAQNHDAAQSLFEVAFAEIERVEQLLSDYRPSSELSRINAADRPVTLDPEMARILNRVLGWSRQSGGAFDPTVGAVVDLWRSDSTAARPSPDALAQALRSTGLAAVELDITTRELRRTRPGVRLDPGGFGKGYALDEAARALRDIGVESALLGFGGSSYLAIGSPPGQAGWLIHVDDPTPSGSLGTSVTLRDAALSTSGNSRRPHILDPRTGLVSESSIQATIVGPNAMDADVLSTAAFVMGPEGAASLLMPVTGVQAWIIHPSPDGPRVRTIRWPTNESGTP